MFSSGSRLGTRLIHLGSLLVLFSVVILLTIYFPIARVEVAYQIQKNSPRPETVPLDKDFGLVIKKINANAHVIANVDPFNPQDYQAALARGVAHAKGSALPGETGNVFLFSHSSADFGTATRYNSIFYLLDKLSVGDEVDLYYQGKLYVYQLTDKLLVGPEAVSYLEKGNQNSLTLMTCWPPGTSLKRLIWQASLVRVQLI